MVKVSKTLVSHLSRLRASKQYRDETNKIVLFGSKLIRDVSKHVEPLCVLATNKGAEACSFCEEHFLIDHVRVILSIFHTVQKKLYSYEKNHILLSHFSLSLSLPYSSMGWHLRQVYSQKNIWPSEPGRGHGRY